MALHVIDPGRSFPVPPEVGKIGNNSPTFIQPVSERSDGIKSFFQKQQPSPAKKGEKMPSPEKVAHQDDEEKPTKAEIKEEAEGIKAEVADGDQEKGLGDDSNAPNPEASAEEKPSIKEEAGAKRKRGKDAELEDEVQEKKPEKRGGHQTRVIRRTSSDDGNKAVSDDRPATGSYQILMTYSATLDHELLQDTREGKSRVARCQEEYKEREDVICLSEESSLYD